MTDPKVHTHIVCVSKKKTALRVLGCLLEINESFLVDHWWVDGEHCWAITTCTRATLNSRVSALPWSRLPRLGFWDVVADVDEAIFDVAEIMEGDTEKIISGAPSSIEVAERILTEAATDDKIKDLLQEIL